MNNNRQVIDYEAAIARRGREIKVITNRLVNVKRLQDESRWQLQNYNWIRV